MFFRSNGAGPDKVSTVEAASYFLVIGGARVGKKKRMKVYREQADDSKREARVVKDSRELECTAGSESRWPEAQQRGRSGWEVGRRKTTI